MLQVSLDESPTALNTSPLADGRALLIGYVDGRIDYSRFDNDSTLFETSFARQLRSAVRAVQFSSDATEFYALARSGALSVYDVEAQKRTRCILHSHTDHPNVMCLLPSSATKGQQLVTADDSGEIKTWDLRIPTPLVSTYNEQTDTINALTLDGNTLLAASADLTLAAYEIRRRKLLVRSEEMHTELLSIALSEDFCYVGSGDGHLETFNRGEYGNILERVETGHTMGVDSIVRLRSGLLATASAQESAVRLLHVQPTKRLGVAGRVKDGVDKLELMPDKKTLVAMSSFGQTLQFWPMNKILDKVPILRADDMKKTKKAVKENFFDGLVEKDDEDSDEDDEDEDEEESVEGESEEDEEDSDEGNAKNVVNGKATIRPKRAEEEDSDEDEEKSGESGEESDGDENDIAKTVSGQGVADRKVVRFEKTGESDEDEMPAVKMGPFKPGTPAKLPRIIQLDDDDKEEEEEEEGDSEESDGEDEEDGEDDDVPLIKKGPTKENGAATLNEKIEVVEVEDDSDDEEEKEESEDSDDSEDEDVDLSNPEEMKRRIREMVFKDLQKQMERGEMGSESDSDEEEEDEEGVEEEKDSESDGEYGQQNSTQEYENEVVSSQDSSDEVESEGEDESDDGEEEEVSSKVDDTRKRRLPPSAGFPKKKTRKN